MDNHNEKAESGSSIASRLTFEVRRELGRLKDRLILERCGFKIKTK